MSPVNAPTRDMSVLNESELKPYTLQLDFRWRDFHYLVSETEACDKTTPLYDVNLRCSTAQTLSFKEISTGTIFGTSQIHLISINADCTLRGETFQLEALRRLALRYTHVSRALKASDGTPERLTWTSDCGFKDFDWICLDANQMPIAKLNANMWALKKIAKLEFTRPRHAISRELVEEIVVTALTLYCILGNRINSPFQLLGSAVHKKPKLQQQQVVDVKNFSGSTTAAQSRADSMEVSDAVKRRPQSSEVLA